LYRALIVDDELAARETLQCLIQWDRIGFEQPVCANNGLQALELYKQNRFDVVFTDIEMPLMDGLELIEQIRALCPKQKVVVISCHESFEYARCAMRLGVDDYLIKDLMNADELYVHMVNIKSELEAQSDYLNIEKKYDINDIVERLLVEDDTITPQERAMAEELMGLNKKEAIAALSVIVDSYEKMKAKLRQEANTWYQSMASFKAELQLNSLASVEIKEGEYLLIFQAGDSFSMLNFINYSIQYANYIRSLANKLGILSVSIGISNFSSKLSDIPVMYEQAFQACGMRVVAGLNKSLMYHGIGKQHRTFDKTALDRSVRQVKELLFNADLRCLKLVQRLYATDMIDGFMELNYYNYLNSRLYGVAFDYIDQNEISYSTLFQNNLLDIEEIAALETAIQMADCFCKIFQILIEQRKGSIRNDGSLTQRAKHVIEENYDKGITLGDIANTLHVHKGYLCRVFKEETGENLMQYVINFKIEKAKEMLFTTSLKLYEISEKLGFASPQYFSSVFKRQTNLTPNEYKKQNS